MLACYRRSQAGGGGTGAIPADQRQEDLIRLELARKRNTKTTSTEAKLTSRSLRRSGRQSTQQRHHAVLLESANRTRIEAIVARVSAVVATAPFSTEFSHDDKEFVLNWVDEVDLILTAFIPCTDPRRDPLGRMVDKLSWLQHSYTCLAEAGVDAKALIASWERDGVLDSDSSDDNDDGGHPIEQISFDDMEAGAEFARKERLVRRKAAARIIRRNVQNGPPTSHWSKRVEEFRLFGNTFYKDIDTPLVKTQTLKLFTDEAKAVTVTLDLAKQSEAARQMRLTHVMHLAQHVATFKVDDAIRHVAIAMQKRKLLENRCAVKLQLKWRAYKATKAKMMVLVEELRRRKKPASTKVTMAKTKAPSNSHRAMASPRNNTPESTPTPRNKTPELESAPRRPSPPSATAVEGKSQSPPPAQLDKPLAHPPLNKPKTPDKPSTTSTRKRPTYAALDPAPPAQTIQPQMPEAPKTQQEAEPPRLTTHVSPPALKSSPVRVSGRKGSILGSLVTSLADEKRLLDMQNRMDIACVDTEPGGTADDHDKPSPEIQVDGTLRSDEAGSALSRGGMDVSSAASSTPQRLSVRRRKSSVLIARSFAPSLDASSSADAAVSGAGSVQVVDAAAGGNVASMALNKEVDEGGGGGSDRVVQTEEMFAGDGQEDGVPDEESIRALMAAWAMDSDQLNMSEDDEYQRRLEAKLKSRRALKKSALMVVLANSMRKVKARAVTPPVDGSGDRSNCTSSGSSSSDDNDDDAGATDGVELQRRCFQRYRNTTSTSRLCSFGGVRLLRLQTTAAHADITCECAPFSEDESRQPTPAPTTPFVVPDLPPDGLPGAPSSPCTSPTSPSKSPPRVGITGGSPHSNLDAVLSLPRLPEPAPPPMISTTRRKPTGMPAVASTTTLALPICWKGSSHRDRTAATNLDHRPGRSILRPTTKATIARRNQRRSCMWSKARGRASPHNPSRLTNVLPSSQFVDALPSRATDSTTIPPTAKPPLPHKSPTEGAEPAAAAPPGSRAPNDPFEAAMAAYIGMLYASSPMATPLLHK
ncbi:hypothetical protein H310_02549 [Aphanomyces invadans]|uniref:Uncharacterized protein n=1 Tax=Aphanomyces invadans TaxID=157072 RepID=A0A024UJ80_9STRA|nr:hypothetical protein H310_02549 [Aphanomyces invadans]ETW06255.1 hypothetical protein H310_02549 [Aphanomyces invadans]|eukprot:XP_008864330.1 hypothetical protein H310_02549 [Aphanomyces invadans]